MKRILILGLMAILVMGIYNYAVYDPYQKTTMPFEERDSQAYLSRSVKGDPGEVLYGKSTGLENGAANTVAAIVVDYRSFDTLGEVTVLFISSLGVAFLSGGFGKTIRLKHKPSFLLQYGARFVFGIILVFGAYMFLHGHLTPGGGFPGGAIIAASALVLYLGGESSGEKMKAFKILEGAAGSLYVLSGIVGLYFAGFFMQNVLPSGIVGHLFSAGIMPVIYILIGLKVGSELTGILDYFMREEVSS